MLVVAHRNSLRALAARLDQLPERAVEALVVPTGEPFAYRIDLVTGAPLGRADGGLAAAAADAGRGTFTGAFFRRDECMESYRERRAFIDALPDRALATFSNLVAAPEECLISFDDDDDDDAQ